MKKRTDLAWLRLRIKQHQQRCKIATMTEEERFELENLIYKIAKRSWNLGVEHGRQRERHRKRFGG